MDLRDFCMWLRGVLETNPTPTAEMLATIVDKLAKVHAYAPVTMPMAPWQGVVCAGGTVGR